MPRFAFFTLKSARFIYPSLMRFGLMVAIALNAGLYSAQAQIQLLPEAVSPARPTVKTPKPDRIAATQGNFPRRMKREEIEPLFFNSRDIEATGSGRASFRVTFFKTGQAERFDHKTNATEQGSWRFLGDGYCSKWAKAYEGCYTIVKDGEIYKIVRGTRAVAFWTPPAEGAAVREPPAQKQDLPEPQTSKKSKKKKAKKH
jgi:hypothetical protein